MPTAHKRASNRLFPSENELSTVLLDAIPTSVLVLDAHGTIRYANNNYLESSRKVAKQILGKPLEKVFPKVILESTPLLQQIKEVASGSEPVRGEKMTYRAPGVPTRIYYYSILPLQQHVRTESPYVMLLMEDITEQTRLSAEVQRVERELAGVVENAGDIILSTDADGHILTWNAAAEVISGITVQEAREKTFFDFFTDEDEGRARAAFVRMRKGRASHEGEWKFHIGKRRARSVSWRLSPMRDEFGNFQGVVAVGRDLTENKDLEEKLRHSQKLAALGVMAGGIAHEIRNPLAVCSSAAQILDDQDLAPELRSECTEKVLSSISRASDIIDNLLRFARPGDEEQEKSSIPLDEVIDESIKLVDNQARVQKITIGKRLKPVQVRGIPDLLRQVFFNLFINAIKAMPEGGKLSVAMLEKNNLCLVKIRDTGVGIAQEDIDKIFDPFHTTAPVGKGTGLGLSITYAIVQEHGGTMSLTSTPEKGTTFIVELPT